MGEEPREDDEKNYDQGCFGKFLVVITTMFIVLLFPITIWFCIKIVQEYERAAIFRLGRLKAKRAVGPGMFWVNMFTDTYIKVLSYHYYLCRYYYYYYNFYQSINSGRFANSVL